MSRKKKREPYVYPDLFKDYGEEFGVVASRYIDAAAVRSDRLHRALAELRGVIPPARYESYLGRLRSTVTRMDVQASKAAERAELKLHDIEDELIRRICEARGADSADADLYRVLGYDDPEGMAAKAAVVARLRVALAARGLTRRDAIKVLDLEDDWEAWHILSGHVAYRSVGELEEMLAAVEAFGRTGSGQDSDWLEQMADERRKASPTFAQSETRVQAEGGYVIERPIEGDDGEVHWEVVVEGP